MKRPAQKPPAPAPAPEAGELSPETWWLIAITFAALLLRLFYLEALGRTPFFEPISAQLDDGLYDQRALQIAAGDWLGRSWTAQAYHTTPYPYFLAAIYWSLGRSVWTAQLLQMLAGTLTPLFLYALAREAFEDKRAALIAAALGAAYVPFIYFEGFLLGESLCVAFLLAGFTLMLPSFRRDGPPHPRLFGSGVLLGVAALLRPQVLTAMLLPVLYVGREFARKAGAARPGVLAALSLAAGLAAGIAPVTVKNYVLYHEFIPISASGGVMLYMGNNPEVESGKGFASAFGAGLHGTTDRAAAEAEQAEGRRLRPSEVSAYWVRRTARHVLESPGSFARGMLNKTLLFFNRFEFPDVRDMRFIALFIPLLKAGAFEYGVVAALALCGAALCLPGSGPAAVVLFLFAAGYAASVVMFYITARYRLPVAPFFILFAAAALERLRAAWAAKDRARLGRALALAAASGVITFLPLTPMNFSNSYNSLALYHMHRGNLVEAERLLIEALKIEPHYKDALVNLSHLYRQRGDEARARAIEAALARGQ